LLRIFITKPNWVKLHSNIHVVTVSIKQIGRIDMIGDYAASWLPVAMVPFVGLVIPAVAMALLFIYIENESPAK
jgi:photosystem I subunit VIII